VKIKIIKLYFDLIENKLIESGTEITVPDERGKRLIDRGIAKEIKENNKKK